MSIETIPVLRRVFSQVGAMAILVFACSTRIAVAEGTAYLERPVDLRSCSIASGISNFAIFPLQRIEGVNVSFVNSGPYPLGAVTFEVSYNGKTQTVTDLGTFSPGIRIDHQLRALESEAYAGSAVACKVSAYRVRGNNDTISALPH